RALVEGEQVCGLIAEVSASEVRREPVGQPEVAVVPGDRPRGRQIDEVEVDLGRDGSSRRNIWSLRRRGIWNRSRRGIRRLGENRRCDEEQSRDGKPQGPMGGQTNHKVPRAGGKQHAPQLYP